jgi:hypothetical protein
MIGLSEYVGHVHMPIRYRDIDRFDDGAAGDMYR